MCEVPAKHRMRVNLRSGGLPPVAAELKCYASRTLVFQQRRFLQCVTSDDLEEKKITEAERIKYLRIALVVVGLTFTFGIWPLTIVWPSGWS